MHVPSLRASVVAPLALVERVNIINRRASHGLRIAFDKISEHNLHLCCQHNFKHVGTHISTKT